MNSQIVLGVIAAIVAVLGVVLFGRPKGRDQVESDRVERVVNPVNPTDLSVLEDEEFTSLSETVPTPTEPVQPAPERPAPGQDPTLTTASDSTGSLPPQSATVSPAVPPLEIQQTEPGLVSLNEVIYGEAAIQAALVDDLAVAPLDAAVVEELTSTEARAQAAIQTMTPGRAAIVRPSSGPFSPIQDPKRPPTPELQELSQEILQMGYAPDLSHLPQLIEYASHPQPIIRCYAAAALEQCARRHPDSDHLETILTVLAQLGEDSDREVQQIAGRLLQHLQSAA
jgi:hypothetical protein